MWHVTGIEWKAQEFQVLLQIRECAIDYVDGSLNCAGVLDLVAA
jgi:hypothetical protein